MAPKENVVYLMIAQKESRTVRNGSISIANVHYNDAQVSAQEIAENLNANGIALFQHIKFGFVIFVRIRIGFQVNLEKQIIIN